MSWDQILTGFIYLVVVLVLVVIGKWVYTALHRGFVLRTELLEKDHGEAVPPPVAQRQPHVLRENYGSVLDPVLDEWRR